MSENKYSETYQSAPSGSSKFIFRPSPLEKQASTLFKGSINKELNIEHKVSPLHLLSSTNQSLINQDSPLITNRLSSVEADNLCQNSSQADTNPSFIFGQKIGERVVKNESTSSGSKMITSENCNADQNQATSSSTLAKDSSIKLLETGIQPLNNLSEGEFKNNDLPLNSFSSNNEDINDYQTNTSNSVELSLAESAARQQMVKEMTNVKQLKHVDVTTGEEKEINIFQVNAKLHIFDNNVQNWQERGRGLLRLNDMVPELDEPIQSRLVMRTQGSLRVVLNTKLWGDMLVEKSGQKSIKISAVDQQDGIKIFVITANQVDTEQVYNCLKPRIEELKRLEIANVHHFKNSPSACGIKSDPNINEGDENLLINSKSEDSVSVLATGKRRSLVTEENLTCPLKKNRLEVDDGEEKSSTQNYSNSSENNNDNDETEENDQDLLGSNTHT